MYKRIASIICCATLAALLAPSAMAKTAQTAAQTARWMVTAPAARLYESLPKKDKPLTQKDSDFYEAARVVHGNILTGKLKNSSWLQILDGKTTVGYVAVSHLAQIPDSFKSSEPKNYMVTGQDVVPCLMPGKFPLSDSAYCLAVVGVDEEDESDDGDLTPAKAFSLRRGTVVVSIGSVDQDGKTWHLISFNDTKAKDLAYAEEDDDDFVLVADGLGGRYAWIAGEDLQDLASYKPTASGEPFDLNRLSGVPNDEAYRQALAANGFYLDPRRIILGTKNSEEEEDEGYYPSGIEQDDLVDLYNRQRTNECSEGTNEEGAPENCSSTDNISLPRFITADLGLHMLHLLFDRSLQQVEEEALLPMTKKLVSALQDELKRIAPEYQKTALGPDALATVKDYLDIAGSLLSEKPQKMSSRAKEEYDRIMAAIGTKQSALTGADEIYALYKPRGHYTLNENLSRYFRGMSLLGTMGFAVTADEKGAANTAVTALLCRLLSASKPSKAWNDLNDPLTKLIGNSNTNTYLTFAKAVSDAGIGAFESKEAMIALAGQLTQAAQKQLVSATNSKDAQAPQFRLLGKRVTFDAMMYTALTTPRLPEETKRRLPDPAADALAVLGSKAGSEIADEYASVEKYKENWDKTAALWPEFSQGNDTFYTNWLLTLQDYFTEKMPDEAFCHTEAWQWRKLYTAAASMAELKHDTILYAEQSGAEMGDAGAAFLATPFPQPIPRGYIEPQPKVFDRLADACRRMVDFLDRFNLNGEDESESYAPRFQALEDDFARMAEISRRELTDSMTLEDYQWINSFCPPSVLPIGMFDVSSENKDQLKMALIADVASSADTALYMAVGTPRRLVVFLDDRSGGARLAEGFTMSYYELLGNAADRLTDEDWKSLVYDEEKDISEYEPVWADKVNK
ncbi:superfamily II RNA helicase [Jonquetella anthropi DSM 22815]|uniref:Superfamily II RNA helicase n=2 Tax=Jonquetella TaxID=428711 RepID=H0UJS0_9BACT|nr:superfamily II RNA helicase [Jonquetella anthropi DSM 22815]